MNFDDIGRLPTPGDNAAIAARRLDVGTQFVYQDTVVELSHTVLEGHRFAVEPIRRDDYLRSWGLPFGKALRTIEPGEYLCNEGILQALKLRDPDFDLPERANFQDYRDAFALDEYAFQAGTQVPRHEKPGSFEGYARPGGRGVGTRNDVVILATTSNTASFAKALESRLAGMADQYNNIDSITAVTHTEGGGSRIPNNLEFVLRVLAGFIVHPNVGAVLAVDFGSEVLTNVLLEQYLRDNGYPLDDVMHRFYSLTGSFATALDEAEKIVRNWLDPVNEMRRSSQPLTELRIALQCGGSDAFSGVSGNPLAAWTAKEFIRHGASAALAETDELIGAEPYILANTRDLDTAKRFLNKIAIFKERIGWHGHSAEGNTSGGNKLRGLYNNALKSIGAARKKDPDICLDYVIDYGQRMTNAGFYFMDSPGNDLESIAGQVAAGCNMIYFITGNGSITNFPFVPTVKFITTTGRWELLSNDMDVNAGRYQDGTPLQELGQETFDYTRNVASGKLTVGEQAGHSQVSIWRDWRQSDSTNLDALLNQPRPDGKPIELRRTEKSGIRIQVRATRGGFAGDQVGLIAPTSLCSGQIASIIARQLSKRTSASRGEVSRFVALPHTEGCGNSSGENEEIYTRTLIGHLLHPFVREALLLEHGCEHTHNGLMRDVLNKHGIDPARFGYASIQLDGGIEKVVNKVENWFAERLDFETPTERSEAGLETLSLGLVSPRPIPVTLGKALAEIVATIVSSGGNVVIPGNATLLDCADFLQALGLDAPVGPSIDYGQVVGQAGLHVMATPTGHVVETLTGLGGTGVQVILACVGDTPIQGHPMIPVLQATSDAATDRDFWPDMDFVMPLQEKDAGVVAGKLLDLICDTASQVYQPRLWAAGNTDFQFTRGMLGVSL